MNRISYRTRLLGSAALGLGLAFAASPAQAVCTVSATTLDCISNTTTTDTTGVGPADRNYVYNTGGGGIFGIVDPGVVVDGFGLSMTDGGTGTNALTFTNNGSIVVTAGNTPTAGGSSGALLLNSVNTPIIYGGAGTISNLGTGDGLEIHITGTGTITVTTTGAIAASAGNGITTLSTSGNQIVNVGANVSGSGAGMDGVNASSTGGTLTVNVTGGNVTGTDDAIFVGGTAASKIVNISAGRTVSGAFGVDSQGPGNVTINNSGTITGSSTAILAANNAVTMNNNATGTLNGRVVLGALVDTFTNAGTWNIIGASDFGAGADVLNNQAAGIITLTGNASIANLETFTQAGRINLNTFTLTGPAIAFVNAGTIDTNGSAGLAGFTSLSNTGTMDLAAGTLTVPAVAFANSGTIIADEGATTITGQTAFNNSGAIRLNDGATGDTLTIVGPFVGSGASNLNVDASSTAADTLVITGAASGSTVINVQPVGGVVVNSTGILVVDTGTSTASAFTLGSTIGTSLIDFSLQQIGQDYFLFAAPNANAFDPLALINVGTDMWYQSADIYSNYSALKRSDLTAGARPLGLWGQVYLSRDRYGDSDTQTVFGTDVTINERLRTDRRGVQGGADYNFGGGVVGITGGWQRAKADLGGSVAEVKGTGWNVGGYGIFGSATGFYGGMLVKYDRNRLRIDGPAFVGLGRLNSRSLGAEGEVGYRIPFGTSTLDLGGGLAWVNTKHEDFTFGGIGYDYAKSKSLRGRLGARFESGVGVFLDGKVYHEFRDNNHLRLVSGAESDTIDAEGRGTWFRGELGYGKPGSSGPIAAVWGELGDVHGIGGKLGFRFGGARVVEAVPPPPPPPPPPPAPPPATQTCPDGSVILATDACPVPPPAPPPPPPAPERGL
jgi:outer membrane autotransporter protein